MKKTAVLLILALLAGLLCACGAAGQQVDIAATTLPVYDFTTRLCEGTELTIGRVVTESVSCLHDYSLQTKQMRLIEGADLVVISGAGLEDFLELGTAMPVLDASAGISLICPNEEHHHEHDGHGHSHESDPHIWLDPENAKVMAQNICSGLKNTYPEYASEFQSNLEPLLQELDTLQAYGSKTLGALSCRQMITFHDGFGYFAKAFDLTILEAVEEESGSEASAAELIHLIQLTQQHHLPGIFTEINGSVSAADIIAAETGASVFALDMAMGGDSYFDAMYHNIDTVKEALG